MQKEKNYRMKRENYKQCDTMGFWEDGADTLETRFRLLIFNIFSLRRTFQSIVSHRVLLKLARCIGIKTRFCASQKSNGSYPSVRYRVFARDVTAAILVSQNNEIAAILLSQTNAKGL